VNRSTQKGRPALRFMPMLKAAGIVGFLLISVSPVLADGVGVFPYRWTYPPKFRRSTNIPALGISETSRVSQSGVFLGTGDDQASVSFSSGAMKLPAGRPRLFVGIQPLRRYPKPRIGHYVLDGNVYGFTYRILPSGQVPTHTVGTQKALISLASPHTPFMMAGYLRGRWRVLCSQNTMFYTRQSDDCYTQMLAPQVALLYDPRSLVVRKKSSSQALPVPIIIAIVIVVAWAAMVVFLITRRRAR
jgi:hypothetical protein